jgi:hypothetical protein
MQKTHLGNMCNLSSAWSCLLLFNDYAGDLMFTFGSRLRTFLLLLGARELVTVSRNAALPAHAESVKKEVEMKSLNERRKLYVTPTLYIPAKII